MDRQKQTDTPHRQRILLVAHSFCANSTMESRLSWFRATLAAEQHDTTVLCAEPMANIRCDFNAQVPGLKIVTVAHSSFEKALMRIPGFFYLAYRLWHRRVLREARALHAQQAFALVHQVSYCGYREPGYCWRLGISFVWGPIGGTQNVPWRFLSQFDTLGAMKEAARSIVNHIQLRFGLRVSQALRAASAVFVANREVQQSFLSVKKVNLPCQLETGIEQITELPRPARNPQRPLRILWAGRLEAWKALPLLLKAVAQLPSDVAVEIRVLGSGSREQSVKRLANQLGIQNQITWVPLSDYNTRDEHYRWAEALAFTSLRDTSGTGLLEALAAGIPLIGLDHQGARDIMTDACALRIRVQNPRQVVTSFRDALVQLARDPQLYQQLSVGSLKRAQNYHWDKIGSEMLEHYADVLKVRAPLRSGHRPSRQQHLEKTPSATV